MPVAVMPGPSADLFRCSKKSVPPGITTIQKRHSTGAKPGAGAKTVLGQRPILVVDDDAALRETLVEQFAVESRFVISTAATLDAADATINAKGARADAVILDVGMPDGDGCDFCDILRRKGHKIPIIMLTGLNSEEDVVRGLEAGASDYVAKPFRFNELFARLRTQLRIFDETSDAAFTIGPYIFRPSAKTLQDSMTDRRSRLTEKEAAILKYLYRADTKPVAREILMQLVWGYESSVSGHALETHIYRLRQKMEPDPTSPALLLTEGSGYRLDPLMGAAAVSAIGRR
jgi:DNA-binding response OmpR family regulator